MSGIWKLRVYRSLRAPRRWRDLNTRRESDLTASALSDNHRYEFYHLKDWHKLKKHDSIFDLLLMQLL